MADKALLVGINDYPEAPLRGCLDDVTRESAFLVERLDFDPNDVVQLLNEDVTAENQKEALKKLVREAKPGDRIEYGYSGHGSTLVIKGKLVCCTCPIDFDFSPEHSLTTDDYMEIFSELPEGISFIWWSDSCHSDLARGMNPFKVVRSYPASLSQSQDIQQAAYAGSEPKVLYRAMPNRLQYPFIGGCLANQTSADAFIDRHYCGAFTHARLKVLEHPESLSWPLTRVVKEAHQWLQNHNYEQDPIMHGEADHLACGWLQSSVS